MSSDGLLGTTAKNFAAQLGSFINNMGDGEAGGGDAGLGLKPEDCKFPMWVISVTDAIAVTSRASDLPCHEDLQSEGLLKKYDPGSMNKCLFLSHTWLRFKHPDSAEGVKKKLINDVLSGIVAGNVAIHAYWFAVVAHLMKDTPAESISASYADGFVWME